MHVEGIRHINGTLRVVRVGSLAGGTGEVSWTGWRAGKQAPARRSKLPELATEFIGKTNLWNIPRGVVWRAPLLHVCYTCYITPTRAVTTLAGEGGTSGALPTPSNFPDDIWNHSFRQTGKEHGRPWTSPVFLILTIILLNIVSSA